MLLKGLAKLTLLFVVLALVPLLAFATGGNIDPDQAPEQVPRYTRHVFLVVVDGLRADILQKVQAPNINGIGSAGVRVPETIPVFPPTLEASTGTILTGTDPSLHRFLKPGDRLAEPTVLEVLEKQNIGTAFFDGSNGRLKGLSRGARHYHACGNDGEVIEAALKYLGEKKPYVSVMVLSGPGKALALSGPDSDEYARAVSEADNRIGELLNFLHQQGLYDQSLFMMTGTGDAPPLIVKGLQFKCGVVLPPAGVIDVAPTLAYVLGSKLPEASGLILWNAMEPGSFQNGLYLMEQRIKDLAQAQVNAYQEIYRLRDEQYQVQDEKARLTAERDETSQAISERDRKIGSLELKVKALVATIFLLLILFGVGYLWEYRYLKKKFLLFS
ncbi:MAG: alkaline phosphatase family protein [Thermoanaerobacterales bacterium]|nr:alkaline phosphatase family protein [Thermoanaerobacterales bacterium]